MTEKEKKDKISHYTKEIENFFEKVVRKRIGGKLEHAFMEWAIIRIVDLESEVARLEEEKSNKRKRLK